MIIDGISYVLLNVLTFLVNIFPIADSNIISSINTNFIQFRNIIVASNFIFPIDTLLFLLNTLFYFVSLIFTFKLGRWLLSNLSAGFFK